MALLIVRYDVTGLPDWEVAALAAEASVQAETSDDYTETDSDPGEYTGHRDVPCLGSVVVEDGVVRRAVERAQTLFLAYEEAGDSRTDGLDPHLDLIVGEVVRAVMGEPSAMVAQVTVEDEAEEMLQEAIGERGWDDDGILLFHTYVALYDPHDADDGPLFLTRYSTAAAGGTVATVLAPDTTETGEVERRLTRFLGVGGWTLQDCQQVTP